MKPIRRAALAVATVAGTSVRVARRLPSIAGAAAVTTGVAFEERGGHGWAWITGGLFGLLAGYEQNRLAVRPVIRDVVT